MRLTVLLTLLAALLIVPSAHAQSTEDILRDCHEDSVLQGEYSASALRKARDSMPANEVEYSDCGDVLDREIAARVAATKTDDGDADTTSGGSGDNDSGPGPAPTAAPEPRRTGKDPGVVTGPSTPQDWKAIDGAIETGGDPVSLNGRPVSRVASIGRNAIPGSVLVVLALVAAAALAAAGPRRRRSRA